ncbi:putative acetyltransferase [Flavimobilis soli]|uniref:Putative acetyltransferase n=1 Tax=Flavimobilis soli TaxID=442709 RepID=A0A2A9EBK2_9MICO|nr:GNAT family N-acetyltransferase [Flavimobilis soli]PFG36026.1 putative acetyltransferase [Flavimobilis soli]
MSFPAGYRTRPLGPEDQREVLSLDSWGFPTGTDLETLAEIGLELHWDRYVGVVTDTADPDAVPIDGARPVRSELVAMHGSRPFAQFPVPGAEIAVGGLTWVIVHPQHRRRGILRAMIDHHFAACRERGEAVSALFAAEATIYGRFGYGLAANDLRVTVPRGAALRPALTDDGAASCTVRIEELSFERHGALIDAVSTEASRRPLGVDAPHEALLNRPGSVRYDALTGRRRLSDPVAFREGKESNRIVIVERDGEPRAFAIMRRESRWEVAGPRGVVHVSEAVVTDPGSARVLWTTLLDLDLMAETQAAFLPEDDVLLELLVDPRTAQARRADNLWVRVVDPAAALAQRRYAAPLDVVLHVQDAVLPENTGAYRVTAGAFEPATAARTDASPDLSLDVRTLGSAYLGGVTLAQLALGGHVVEHTPGALATASAAFAWPVAPVCPWVF